jgi:ribosome-binding factor A
MLVPSLKDPGVSDVGLVTLTHVRVSDDLGTARVLVTLIPDEPLEDAAFEQRKRALLEGLRRASPWLRREVGRALQMKKTPELRFFYDDTADRAERVDQLLREIAAERGAAALGAASPGAEPARSETGAPDDGANPAARPDGEG